MIQMEQLFGTPLIADDLAVSPALAALPAARFDADSSPIAQTVSLGTGRPANAPWPDAVAPVIGHIVALANRGTHDGRMPQTAPDWRVAVSMHVGLGQWPLPRCHEAFWTALYVVRASEGGGDRLDIQDPRLPMPMGEDPNLRLRHLGGKTPSHYQPSIGIELAAGMMFLFPSWLDVRYLSGHVQGAGFAVLRAALIAPLT